MLLCQPRDNFISRKFEYYSHFNSKSIKANRVYINITISLKHSNFMTYLDI